MKIKFKKERKQLQSFRVQFRCVVTVKGYVPDDQLSNQHNCFSRKHGRDICIGLCFVILVSWIELPTSHLPGKRLSCRAKSPGLVFMLNNTHTLPWQWGLSGLLHPHIPNTSPATLAPLSAHQATSALGQRHALGPAQSCLKFARHFQLFKK